MRTPVKFQQNSRKNSSEILGIQEIQVKFKYILRVPFWRLPLNLGTSKVVRVKEHHYKSALPQRALRFLLATKNRKPPYQRTPCHGGVEKRGGRKTSRMTAFPKRGFGPPPFTGVSEPSKPESAKQISKSRRSANREVQTVN